MAEKETLDYLYIIMRMNHTIDDEHIELRIDKNKEGNALKQFSNIVDELIEKAREAQRIQTEEGLDYW